MAGYFISSIESFLAFLIFSCLSLILNLRYLHRFQTSISQAVCAHSITAGNWPGFLEKTPSCQIFFIARIVVNQSTCICPPLVLTHPIDRCSSPVGREQGANLNSSRTKVAITCLRKYCLIFRRLEGPSVLSQLTDIPYAPNLMSPLSSALSGPFVSPCLPTLSSSYPRATRCEFPTVSSVFNILRLSIQAVCARMAAGGSYSEWLLDTPFCQLFPIVLIHPLVHTELNNTCTLNGSKTTRQWPYAHHVPFLNSIHSSPQRPRPVFVIRFSELSQCLILIPQGLLHTPVELPSSFMLQNVHWVGSLACKYWQRPVPISFFVGILFSNPWSWGKVREWICMEVLTGILSVVAGTRVGSVSPPSIAISGDFSKAAWTRLCVEVHRC